MSGSAATRFLGLWVRILLGHACLSLVSVTFCQVEVSGRLITTPVSEAILSNEWVCSHSLPGIVGSNPTGACMFVSCECYVLSGRGLW